MEFERLKDVVGSIKPVFSGSAKLIAQLDVIDKYLEDNLIDEWENKRTAFAGTPEQLTEAELPELQGFLQTRASGGTFDRAANAHGETAKLLLDDLAKLADADS